MTRVKDQQNIMLDRRLNAYRADLADIALKGIVDAERFVTPDRAMINCPVVALRPRPDKTHSIDTELLQGESVFVYEQASGFAWVKAVEDGYVGYLPQEALGPEVSVTHWVSVPRSFVYSGHDLRLPAKSALSLASRVCVVDEAYTRGTRYAVLEDGSAMIADHLLPYSQCGAPDYVAVAARLLETPYLWGGKSAFGIDCSGLVQLSMRMLGRSAPRDSDMQAKSLGVAIEQDALRRGDLVFWKGHVAMMEDDHHIIHASGHSMSVIREPLGQAIQRIASLYGPPTGFRRP